MNMEEANSRLARCDSQHRAEVLVELLNNADDKEAGQLLLEWFNLCDALSPWVDGLRDHFERVGYVSNEPGILNTPLTIYRAAWEDDVPEKALSWTLDYEFAEKFGKGLFGARSQFLGLYRPDSEAVIWKAEATEIYAYITSRNESEIVPRTIVNIEEFARIKRRKK